MYSAFLKSEIKKLSRDSMTKFMLIYPFIVGILSRFFLPWLAEKADFSLELYADLILVILGLLVPIIFGAIIAFSILDDRDDNILDSIKVTPLGIKGFLSFRFTLLLIATYITVVFILWFSNIGDMPIKNILALGILLSIEAPIYGLLINTLSNNKIEGFAVMKALASLIFLPIIALFFIDKREFFFAFAPGFWSAKSISSIIRGEGILNLTYIQYYIIGLFYLILLNILAFRLFRRKTEV